MSENNFEFWITIKNEKPEINDFAEVKAKLYELGIHENIFKIGIALTRLQWINLLQYMSKFESRFITNLPIGNMVVREIMGFPVRVIIDQTHVQ